MKPQRALRNAPIHSEYEKAVFFNLLCALAGFEKRGKECKSLLMTGQRGGSDSEECCFP